jgi:undecaprenyl-diphosphatase
MFGRARPRLIDEVGAYHFDPFTFGYLNASFPSGHSTTVGAIVGILMIWYPRWSLVTIELGLFFAATRIAAGAHYPSDVATGFLIGIFFSLVIARWLASRGVVFRFAPGKILPLPAPVSPRKSRN